MRARARRLQAKKKAAMREAAEKARLEAEAAAEVERLKAERIARLRALGLWDADGDPDEQLEEEVPSAAAQPRTPGLWGLTSALPRPTPARPPGQSRRCESSCVRQCAVPRA
jgi:hypothetical protein